MSKNKNKNHKKINYSSIKTKINEGKDGVVDSFNKKSELAKYSPSNRRLENKKTELDRRIEQKKAELDIDIAATKKSVKRKTATLFSIIFIIAGIEFFIDHMAALGAVILLIGLILMPFIWDKIMLRFPCPKWVKPVLIIALFVLAVFVRIKTTPITSNPQQNQETTQVTESGDEK